MNKSTSFTKGLDVIGTILVWVPILAPFLFGLWAFLQRGMFRFDYLMPAELFGVAFLGGALLFWASLIVKKYRAIIGWGLLVAVLLLVGGQALAVVTGLASGARPAEGWPFFFVIASLVIYTLAVIEVGVGGILLGRHLFKATT
jgi:hypothetical protein